MSFIERIWAWIVSIPSLYLEIGGTVLVAVIIVSFLYRVLRKPRSVEEDDTADDIVGADVQVHTWLYYLTLFILYIAIPTALPVAHLYFGVPVDQMMVHAVIGTMILHLAASIRFVPADFVSAISLFGVIPSFETAFQVIIVPFGLAGNTRVTRKIMQRDLPASAERIFRRDDKDYTDADRANGYRLPFRVTTGPASPDPEDMLSVLNAQLTLELIITPYLQIANPFKFLINRGSIEELWKQTTDRAQQLLTNELASRSGSQVFRELAKIKLAVKENLQRDLGKWGVRVDAVDFSSPDPSHPLNKALRDLAMAEADARKVRLAADAAAYDTREAGKAKADAEAAGIIARGKANAEAAEAMDIDPAYVLELDARREVLGKPGDKFVLGMDSIMRGVTEALGSSRRPDDDSGRGRRGGRSGRGPRGPRPSAPPPPAPSTRAP